MSIWPEGAPGVFSLPSGRHVRGRGLRRQPDLTPDPNFGVYLFSSAPAATPTWDYRLVDWPDFGPPRDPAAASAAIFEAWQRADCCRVEIACMGGTGRTGTFLACMACLDGLGSDPAINWIRSHYARKAVETPEQRSFVSTFAAHRNS